MQRVQGTSTADVAGGGSIPMMTERQFDHMRGVSLLEIARAFAVPTAAICLAVLLRMEWRDAWTAVGILDVTCAARHRRYLPGAGWKNKGA